MANVYLWHKKKEDCQEEEMRRMSVPITLWDDPYSTLTGHMGVNAFTLLRAFTWMDATKLGDPII